MDRQSGTVGCGREVSGCGLSDPRNFTNLCEALALPSGEIRRAVLGKQGREEQDLCMAISGVGKTLGVI